MAISAQNKIEIGIIGAGHMGLALVRGFLRSGVKPSALIVASPQPSKLGTLKRRGVWVVSDNRQAALRARIIMVAVKPQVVASVLSEIRDDVRTQLVVSVAAGITVASIGRNLRRKTRIARIMPNMPVADGRGVIGLFTKNVPKTERNRLRGTLQRLGIVIEVAKEKELDALTLISGCGPGVVSYLLTLMAHEAQSLGLSETDATRVALATFEGTLRHLEARRISPQKLQTAVATKGGVTASMLLSLEKSSFKRDFAKAYKTGQKKIQSIG